VGVLCGIDLQPAWEPAPSTHAWHNTLTQLTRRVRSPAYILNKARAFSQTVNYRYDKIKIIRWLEGEGGGRSELSVHGLISAETVNAAEVPVGDFHQNCQDGRGALFL